MTARAMWPLMPVGSRVSRASREISSSGIGRVCSSIRVTLRPRLRSHSATALGLETLPLRSRSWVEGGAIANTVS